MGSRITGNSNNCITTFETGIWSCYSVINKKYTLFNLISTNEKIFKKYDDNKIKKLGYSILRKDNKIIKNLDDLNIDDKISIDMFRGNIKAKIKELND